MNTEQKLVQLVGIPSLIRQVAIGSHTINYFVAGNGPPLLLLHGANFGWGVWFPNIPELAQHFTVYAIDLPGAGRSSRIDYAKMDPDKDLFEVLVEFVLKLKLEKFNVIGCSIGGWLALKLALRHPELVDKIVIENGIGFYDYLSGADRMIGFYPFAKLITKIFIIPQNRKSVEKFLKGIFYDKKISLPKEFIDYFDETMQTSHNLLFISRLTALHKKFNLESQLPKIKNQTLIVWGEQDKIIPLKKNLENFKLIPNVVVRLIKDAAHIPSLEKPAEFNAIVRNFLLQTP